MNIPAIGSTVGQGTFAGIARGDHMLVVLSTHIAANLATALEMPGELPTRNELALIYAHLRNIMPGGFYWSCERNDPSSMWGMDFHSGIFKPLDILSHFNAVFIRRLPVPGDGM